MAGPGAGSARRPEPTAAQVAAGGPRGGQYPSHGPPPRPGSRQPGAPPGSMGGRGGPRKAAPGRLLRLFPSAALLRPSLRSLFSYSEGSRGAAEGKGRSGRGSVGRVPPVRRRFPPGPSAMDRGRARRRPREVGGRSLRRGSRAGGPAADGPTTQKGGRRVLLTSRPAPLPPRSGAMTPFPVRAPTPTHPKGTHRPPLPRRRHAQRRPHRRSTRRARRQAPPTHPGAPDRPHPRRHRHRHTADAPGIGRRGPRARHITREHVPLADVLAG